MTQQQKYRWTLQTYPQPLLFPAPSALPNEVYGSGEPLLLIHGNGGSSRDLTAQIAHFRM